MRASSVTFSTAVKLNSLGYCPQRTNGRYVRARVTVPAGQIWSNFWGVELDASGRTEEIPMVGIHTYWKRLESPVTGEADAILALPFSLDADAPMAVKDFRYA